MSRSTVFYVTHRLAVRCVAVAASGLGLLACGSDGFFTILPPPDASETESGEPDGDRRDGAAGDGGSAAETSADAASDAGVDSYVCPTGVAACDDAIALLCSRQKGCDAGCPPPASTQQCVGKTICESACLADLKAANCTAIKQTTSPAFVSGNCSALW